VNETTLAYEVMQRVIPGDGVFLGEMHTVRQVRRGALWLPGISVRGGDPSDPDTGVVANARARAKELLRTHQVEPLPDDASRHLDEIVARAHRELAPT
jgi:trimethylamine--corrinoid protein Co-methyltransferase